jgi:hypothetical protein
MGKIVVPGHGPQPPKALGLAVLALSAFVLGVIMFGPGAGPATAAPDRARVATADGHPQSLLAAGSSTAAGPTPSGDSSSMPGMDMPSSDMPSSDMPGMDMSGSDPTSTNMPGMDMPSSDMPSSDMPSSDMPGMDMGAHHHMPAPADATTPFSHSLVLGGFGVLNTVVLAIAWAWRQLAAPSAGKFPSGGPRRPRPSN